MGSILDLNSLTLRMQKDFLQLEHEAQEIYEHVGAHVLSHWGILLAMTLMLVMTTTIFLTRVKYDKR